ncbi:MAG: adenosine kinase [Pseudomonadota bacterium]
MTKTYDVVGIGNAVVDVISEADDSYLDLMGIEKGIMQLVERKRGEMLYAGMKDRVQAAGGSVANTLAGLGALGLHTAFMGRVRDDALGRFYVDEMARVGCDFVNAPVAEGDLPTSRSMIFVSPDGERSMNTYLGISSDVGPEDVPEDVAAGTRIVFLEGYLFDKDNGKAAFRRAAERCRSAGGMAGITLSDPFCVDRHRDDFRSLVQELDYVIGNQQEWESLYQTELSSALEQAAAESGLIVCTRSGHDVVLVRKDEEAVAPVQEITPVDATGAGDQFAAGFLYGLATGAPLEVCGRMGCVAAAEVIGHIGPRPQANVKALFEKEGLI